MHIKAACVLKATVSKYQRRLSSSAFKVLNLNNPPSPSGAATLVTRQYDTSHAPSSPHAWCEFTSKANSGTATQENTGETGRNKECAFHRGKLNVRKPHLIGRLHTRAPLKLAPTLLCLCRDTSSRPLILFFLQLHSVCSLTVERD